MHELIVRIAPRGEGVTSTGRHVAFAVPGDALLDDGALAPGPHHQKPPCRHFPECGGCQLQQADDSAYSGYLMSRIETALAHHGLETDVRDAHLSPPRSRRRASLRALSLGTQVVVGFNAEKSHRIVDMHECHILRPELFALVKPMREFLGRLLKPKQVGDVQLTLVDQGVDLLLKGTQASGLAALEELTSLARSHALARLSLDGGLGPDTVYEPEPVTVSLSRTAVPFPVGAFLQATKDGERALVECVRDAVADARSIADLFAGIGTFALATGAIFAAEASRNASSALKSTRAGFEVAHRDLYRRPLDRDELKSFDAVILDPPRAGAVEQVKALASSTVSTIAYVSCNPATFARDAKTLRDGGYSLEWVRPIGQFRWSTHVELAGCFRRDG